MEGMPGQEKLSLVELKRQEALGRVLDALDERLKKDIGATFESGGREYPLTNAEDCMVAFAQQLQAEVKTLYEEIVAKNDYREEQAVAKIFELFTTYERLIALYTELRSYYPGTASRVEAHVPPLTEIARHGEALWEKIGKQS